MFAKSLRIPVAILSCLVLAGSLCLDNAVAVPFNELRLVKRADNQQAYAQQSAGQSKREQETGSAKSQQALAQAAASTEYGAAKQEQEKGSAKSPQALPQAAASKEYGAGADANASASAKADVQVQANAKMTPDAFPDEMVKEAVEKATLWLENFRAAYGHGPRPDQVKNAFDFLPGAKENPEAAGKAFARYFSGAAVREFLERVNGSAQVEVKGQAAAQSQSAKGEKQSPKQVGPAAGQYQQAESGKAQPGPAKQGYEQPAQAKDAQAPQYQAPGSGQNTQEH